MTELTITLPDDLAGELQRAAERRGVQPGAYAAQIIEEHLPASERAKSLHDLFSQWAAEDATDDPTELTARQQEWEQMKNALDANRGSGRKLFGE